MFTIQSLHVSMEIWGSIFCVITTICMFLSRSFERQSRVILMYMQLSCAVLLAMDACAWGFRGGPGMLAYWMVRISNFLVFFLDDVIVLLFHKYVVHTLFSKETGQKKKLPRRVKLVYIVGIIGITGVIISQFNNMYYFFDANNMYHRNTLHPMALVIGLIAGALDLSLLIQYRKRVTQMKFAAMITYTILPLLSAIALLFFYGISLFNIAITISVIFMFVVAIAEQSTVLSQKQKEMYDLKIAVMISQIGPHFIYNTLGAIKHLCRVDPEAAMETVDEFAIYLRGNIDSLTEQKNIPFPDELRHVKNYLAIEKKRFGDRLNVVYNIEDKGFMIPVLTIQPLAENAVKHGILKRPEGGTLTISSKWDGTNHLVIIEDDGVGYDTEKKPGDGKVHVGLDNVRERVKEMANGTVVIESQEGKGTKVTIQIP